MDSQFPRDPSPRSKPTLTELIKEKMRGADLVAVGVNFVVAALLIGGVVGALTMKDPGTPAADLNAAALVVPDEAAANETAPLPAPGAEEPSGEHDDDEEPGSDK